MILPTPEDLAEKIMAEVLYDVSAGHVPRTVRSFSELHDYVDANCYGGTEALLEQLDADSPDTEEGHAAALNTMCDLMNAAHTLVNEWLADGGAPRTPNNR